MDWYRSGTIRTDRLEFIQIWILIRINFATFPTMRYKAFFAVTPKLVIGVVELGTSKNRLLLWTNSDPDRILTVDQDQDLSMHTTSQKDRDRFDIWTSDGQLTKNYNKL